MRDSWGYLKPIFSSSWKEKHAYDDACQKIYIHNTSCFVPTNGASTLLKLLGNGNIMNLRIIKMELIDRNRINTLCFFLTRLNGWAYQVNVYDYKWSKIVQCEELSENQDRKSWDTWVEDVNDKDFLHLIGFLWPYVSRISLILE